MGLSESERCRLGKIGADLLRDDPCLARLLSGSDRGRRGPRAAAFSLAMVSLAIELGGAFARVPLVCALAWLGAVISVSILLLTPRPSPQRRGRLG